AFKAVQENKQVVYLVPTTILAQQQYNNFVQRMGNYPVNIELMCRFRSNQEIKKTIENLKSGMADIVIGTHRLLSADVDYKDLGLLIIDEEQRFGVNHKEKIKQMKKTVDVLSLSATPIPRTLHMSLVGIRDMSVLDEAPQERTPIQTFVFEYNEEMVREAIVREMARGGQVYYVFNRVRNIQDIAASIEKLVPEATVGYIHGQMTENKVEDIMMQFINQEIDVLVATTIIEIGLDISNVNTIIIHDADAMGLSQLYQLRGRVGRSNRTAFAFLMYKRDKMLKEVAEKRLSAIKEFTDLGSGFKIAMRDLEIRGAGNLLGVEQHGNMTAVGYDLYCKMLNEAVKIEKGEVKEEDSYTTAVDINMEAYLPDTYVQSEEQRIDIYKRIALIDSEEARDDMLDELL
ncbi:MAG: DEAD/DEAH box helicase, partial [Bacteroidaceae bacterium]|nr:DEAD/DEAH box helicase [Bacteroidaceae bacterium]